VPTQSCCPEADGCDEGEGGEVVAGQLVVSGCDASPILEAAEHALDEVAPAIGRFVEWVGPLARGCGRDHRLDTSLLQPSAEGISVVGAVGEEAPWGGNRSQQRGGDADVGDIAGRQREGERSAAIIGQRVNLARAPASRAANRLRRLPLFAPAAER
jgi:hypothetical protein